MLVRSKRSWELPERLATPEAVYLNRRQLLAGGAALVAGAALLSGKARGEEGDPSAALYPVKRNEAYTLDREITDEEQATTYNNYYEFGSFKSIWREAEALPIRPWSVKIDGLVEQEMEIGIDDLLA